jgi:uncharacterized protein
MEVAVKRVLMDALKPRELSIVDLAKALGSVDEKGEIEIIVSEVDARTETLKVTIKGSNIDYLLVSNIMDKFGVSIRGIDEINVARE